MLQDAKLQRRHGGGGLAGATVVRYTATHQAKPDTRGPGARVRAVTGWATLKWVYLFGDLRRFAPCRESIPPDTIINAFPQNTGNKPKAAPIDPNKSGPTTRAR